MGDANNNLSHKKSLFEAADLLFIDGSAAASAAADMAKEKNLYKIMDDCGIRISYSINEGSKLIHLRENLIEKSKPLDVLLFADQAIMSSFLYQEVKKEKLVKHGIHLSFSFLQEPFCKYFLETGVEGYLDIMDETTPERIISEVADVLLCDNATFQNHCYILLGLSGAGKSTLINHLKGYIVGLQQGAKVTTRPKRISTLNEGTEHVTFQEFVSLLANEKLIGVRRYHGHMYGHYRDEIENAKFSGKDIFIDSTQPEMALEIKNLFPDYVKIVAIEKNQRRVRENLIKRYEDMPIFKGVYLDYLKRSKEKRLEETVKMEREYEKMASIADFVLEDNIFHIKQRELRNYILSCRESRIITS